MNQNRTKAAGRTLVLAVILCTPLAVAAQAAMEAGNLTKTTTPAAAKRRPVRCR